MGGDGEGGDSISLFSNPSLKENKCPISGKTIKITTNKIVKNMIFSFLKFIINYEEKIKGEKKIEILFLV